MTFWTPANQQFAFGKLTAGGVQPLGAEALISRWANVESSGAGPLAVNPYSGASGIAQWLGSRQSGLGGDTSFSGQLDYVNSELHSTESASFDQLNAATTPYQAATGASMFERAEGFNSATGVDNFTGVTANGIGAVDQNVNGGMAGQGGIINDSVNYDYNVNTGNFDIPNGQNPNLGQDFGSVAPPSYDAQGNPIASGWGIDYSTTGSQSMFGDTTTTPGIGGDLGAASGVGSMSNADFGVNSTQSNFPDSFGNLGNPASSSDFSPSIPQDASNINDMSNPAVSMASAPGTTNSNDFASNLSGMWEAMGVTAVTKAAETTSKATTQAAQTVGKATTDAANATDTTNTNLVQSFFSAGTDWLVRGGVLFFGLIFLAGGVWFFSRQEA